MFGNSLDKRILKLIATEEKHDRNSVVSSLEMLKLLKQRFLSMQDILKPLVERLSKEMIITNIYFTVELDGLFSINISYIKDNQTGTIVLCQIESDDFDLVVGSQDKKLDKFIMGDKKIIANVFNRGLNELFDRKSEGIKTTSGLLLLSIYNNHFELSNSDKHDPESYFKFMANYCPESFHVVSAYDNLEKTFNDKENVNSFLNHAKIYEKDVPYYLIKK